GRDRAWSHQHRLAPPAAEHVERDETLAGPLRLDLEEGPVRDLRQPTGGPDVAGHSRGKHQRSLSISTPAARARSRASGVSTARRPSTSRAPARAAPATMASVTAPFSIRCAGRTAPCPSAAPSPTHPRTDPAGPPRAVRAATAGADPCPPRLRARPRAARPPPRRPRDARERGSAQPRPPTPANVGPDGALAARD